MKLLKTLILICLLLFPFGELLRFDLGSDIAVRLLDLLVLFTAISFIANSIKNKKIPKTYLNKPILIFGLICLTSLVLNISALNSVQFFTSFLYLLRWVSYACIFFVVSSFEKKIKVLVKKLLLFDGLIILSFGYIQYFLYPNLRNLYYLGWDEHNYRMFSTFLDPNFLGAFLVLYFLFLTSFLSRKNKYFQLLMLVMALTLIGIFLTFSRGAILMLVVSLGVYFTLIERKKYMLGLIGSVVVLIMLLTPIFTTENTNLFRTTSSLARVKTYRNAFKIIIDHPVLGVGFNAYRYAQESYGFENKSTKYPSHGASSVDNSFLFVLATTGVIGLLAYLNIWKTIFNHFRKSPIIIASIFGLFINSFFINSLFFPSMMLWMWALIGIIEDS